MFSKQKIKKCVVILVVMIIISVSLIFYSTLNPLIVNFLFDEFSIVTRTDNMLVHFINVGQADAVAVNLPDGKVLLIDSGSQSSSTDYVNYIKENVTNSKRNNYIDYMVLTHADEDHIGGALKLIKTFEIGTIFMPKVTATTAVFTQLKEYVDNNCNFQILGTEMIITGKDYQIKMFQANDSEDTNDSSQLIKLEGFGTSILFTADISSSVASEYAEKYNAELDCDILKVAHHGGKDNTNKEFLDLVTPDYAVISVGEDNNYGHPHEDVISLLNEENIKILRTDESGDILFAISDIYGVKVLADDFNITSLKLNYVAVVLFCDLGLIAIAVSVVAKKER